MSLKPLKTRKQHYDKNFRKKKKLLEIVQTNKEEWTFLFNPETVKDKLLDRVITRMQRQPS